MLDFTNNIYQLPSAKSFAQVRVIMFSEALAMLVWGCVDFFDFQLNFPSMAETLTTKEGRSSVPIKSKSFKRLTMINGAREFTTVTSNISTGATSPISNQI